MVELKSNGRIGQLGRIGLRLWSLASGRRKHSASNLSRQFLMTATLIVGVSMLMLGNWMSSRYQASATRSAAEAGAIFLQAFLQPYIQELGSADPLAEHIEERLDTLFAHTLFAGHDVSNRFILLKIWRLDGTLAYSSNDNIKVGEQAENEVKIAASGGLATAFEDLDELLDGVTEDQNIRLIEVYAPLYQTGTNRIIAVGEFYQSAAALIAERTSMRNWTWLLVGLTSIGMIAVLNLIVSRGSKTIDRQRDDLNRRYAEAAHLAKQNDELRKAAERARVRASEDNENFLARLGSELHDGPIQTLSILMLSLKYGRDGEESLEPGDTAKPGGSPPNTIQLARYLYSELRNISSGLVLPGIQAEGLAQVVEAAIYRHEQLTGTSVERNIGTLPTEVPTAVKICCYRVIQEGLNNAYRHAAAAGQSVAVKEENGRLLITVSDRGPGVTTQMPEPTANAKLGLVGLKNRLAALSGELSIISPASGGTELVVMLPLDLENRALGSSQL